MVSCPQARKGMAEGPSGAWQPVGRESERATGQEHVDRLRALRVPVEL